MLDVRRMRVLREVGRCGSFSAAAQSLSFTQSAVSQQIAALEKEAGVVLVDRSARGVRLTHAGEVVVRHADAILGRLAEVDAELEALAGLRAGRVRLGTFESAGSTLVPPAFAEFRRRHPAIELSMLLGEDEDNLPRLRDGELDLVLVEEATPGADDGFARTSLLEDPLYLVMAADHPLADRPDLRFADFAGDAWIAGSLGTCDCNRILMRSCAAAGFEPRIAFTTDDYTAMKGFAAAGVGVCLIAGLGLTTLRDDIVVRSLGPETPVRHISAVVREDAAPVPAVEAMTEILVALGASQAGARVEPTLRAAA